MPSTKGRDETNDSSFQFPDASRTVSYKESTSLSGDDGDRRCSNSRLNAPLGSLESSRKEETTVTQMGRPSDFFVNCSIASSCGHSVSPLADATICIRCWAINLMSSMLDGDRRGISLYSELGSELRTLNAGSGRNVMKMRKFRGSFGM